MEIRHAKLLLVQLEALGVKTVQVVLVWKLVIPRLVPLVIKVVLVASLVVSRLGPLGIKAVLRPNLVIPRGETLVIKAVLVILLVLISVETLVMKVVRGEILVEAWVIPLLLEMEVGTYVFESNIEYFEIILCLILSFFSPYQLSLHSTLVMPMMPVMTVVPHFLNLV